MYTRYYIYKQGGTSYRALYPHNCARWMLYISFLRHYPRHFLEGNLHYRCACHPTMGTVACALALVTRKHWQKENQGEPIIYRAVLQLFDEW